MCPKDDVAAAFWQCQGFVAMRIYSLTWVLRNATLAKSI